jgi:hypothetical protein
MAQLQNTNATSMTVDSNTVWTAANDAPGTGTAGLDANALAGYDIRYLEVAQNKVSFNQLASASNSLFYPVVFGGQSWAEGAETRTMYMNITRSTNQDGTNFGSLNAKVRYRSTNWGYHRSYWELTENWGSGTYYPFIASAANSPHNTFAAIWLRGGVTYNFQYGDGPEFIVDGTSTNPKGGSNNGFGWNWVTSDPSATLSALTSVSIPSNAHYYQQGLCSKGYDLGSSTFRWQNCFVNAKDISSDVRYKENFDESYGKSFLDKLMPKSYILKDDPKKIRHLGFIAQEVYDALIELGIDINDFAGFDGRNPDHLALSYDQFIPVIINAIKQADSDITDLLEMLDELEKNNGDV